MKVAQCSFEDKLRICCKNKPSAAIAASPGEQHQVLWRILCCGSLDAGVLLGRARRERVTVGSGCKVVPEGRLSRAAGAGQDTQRRLTTSCCLGWQILSVASVGTVLDLDKLCFLFRSQALSEKRAICASVSHLLSQLL